MPNRVTPVAIVTGASRGIGYATAKLLASRGYCVGLIYQKNDLAMQQVCREFDQHHYPYQVFKGDVADKVFAREVVKSIKQQWGNIQVLVNNAGITKDQYLALMNEADWDAVMDTNLKSVYVFSQAVLTMMMAQKKGSIVNVSSLTAIAGREGQTAYGAAKAGLLGFTKSLAREVGPKNIRVNAVIAGLIQTDMLKKLSDTMIQDMMAHIPLKRLGTIDDVANVIGFLVSEDAAYVTGTSINVSGGEYV